MPAFDELLAAMGDAYAAKAPEQVDLSRYPGGKHYLSLPGRAVHDAGLYAGGGIRVRRMAQIQAEMARIRAEVGFEGEREAFRELLRNDPRFIAPRRIPLVIPTGWRQWRDRFGIASVQRELPPAPRTVFSFAVVRRMRRVWRA